MVNLSLTERVTQIDNKPKHPSSISKIASWPLLVVGVGAYLLIVSIPILAVTWLDGQVLEGGWVAYGITVSGTVAFAMVVGQFMLMARITWFEQLYGFSLILWFHKAMAVIATLLVLLHMSLLVSSRGNWDLIVFPLASWPVQLGRFAAVCMAAILAISFWRRWMPVNDADWRWFHNALAWSILLSGFLHGFVMSSSFDNLLLSAIWTSYLMIAILAWIERHYFSWKR